MIKLGDIYTHGGKSLFVAVSYQKGHKVVNCVRIDCKNQYGMWTAVDSDTAIIVGRISELERIIYGIPEEGYEK